MSTEDRFQLYGWLTSNAAAAKAILGGSATPYLTLDEIVSLSSDPKTTKAAFSFSDLALSLSSAQGLEQLRIAIANLYDRKLSLITRDNVIVTNATTGANHLIYRTLLKAGDHVIIQYPTYGPLYEEPADIGCDLTFWRLGLKDNWNLDLSDLKRLIKPGTTKMLILNNPSNPTGTFLATQLQREIIKIAKEHDIIIHCDEIFRPLFHNTDVSPSASSNDTAAVINGDTAQVAIPTSLIEHADTVQYDKVIVTASLSKAYGLSGVRIGWIATRNPAFFTTFMQSRLFSIQSTSLIDEYIGAEALSPRCRPGILRKHLDIARINLNVIQELVDEHSDQCEWVRPTAGACAFIKFKDVTTGQAVDDIAWAKRLVQEKGVLLSPASMCFSYDETRGKDEQIWRKEFRGRFRVQFTTYTETVKLGMKLIAEFLEEEKARAGLEKL